MSRRYDRVSENSAPPQPVMASLGSAFRSVWHTFTSYDRHASHDSPYTSGHHVPLPQSRHAPLTSIATSASDSRADINSPYYNEQGQPLNSSANNYPSSPSMFPSSPGVNSPYSPGMRSSAALKRQSTNENFENVTPGEIQLQAFQEGLPPPPPVTHSWKRIDRWAEENYEELFDNLCEGCTVNDLNELEHQLDCSLPMEVRESLQMHDGQERGGNPTGIIFGCMLLDCEEIVQEWEQWKVVNQEYLSEPANFKPAAPAKALGGSSSNGSSSKAPPQANNPNWRQELLGRQDSQPPNSIQKVYAHPAWIPLVRDWGGNNLAIDLAPGPTGKWGQVILFGRDYDCKYVVARSWSAFMATVADDLGSGKWFVEEETQELKLREFKSSKVEPGYLDILRWRMDQKYGRRGPGGNGKRRSQGPMGGPSNSGSPIQSPYASPPADVGEPRGRSMQRFSGASPVTSPQRTSAYGAVSSPLARVNEESQAGTPLTIQTSTPNLVEVATPKVEGEKKDDDENLESLMTPVTLDDEENAAAEKQAASVQDEHAMKTIDI